MESDEENFVDDSVENLEVKTVEDLEKYTELKARYELGFSMFMNSGGDQNITIPFVASALNLNIDILREYIQKSRQNVVKLKVAEILSNKELKSQFDVAVREFLSNKLAKSAIAERLGVDFGIFHAYLVATVPNYIHVKGAQIVKNARLTTKVPEQKSMIRIIPQGPPFVLTTVKDNALPVKVGGTTEKQQTSVLTSRKQGETTTTTTTGRSETSPIVIRDKKVYGLLQSFTVQDPIDCENRVRPFKDRGLSFDATNKRVKCTVCNVILVDTDTGSLNRHCEWPEHVSKMQENRPKPSINVTLVATNSQSQGLTYNTESQMHKDKLQEIMETLVREFEGLTFDKTSNSVKCSFCKITLLQTDSESLSRHCKEWKHIDKTKKSFARKYVYLDYDGIRKCVRCTICDVFLLTANEQSIKRHLDGEMHTRLQQTLIDTCEIRVRQFENQGLHYDKVMERVRCSQCNTTISNITTPNLAYHCQSRHGSELEEEEIDMTIFSLPQQDPLHIPQDQFEAPKDSVGPGENSWAAQTSQAPMPSTSRAKEMSPRPSTSATHTGGFLIKQDPGTPPPVQQQVMNPYIQEPPMVQSAPRLLPKPSVPPPQSQVQQQPRLRVRQPQHVAPAPAPPDPDPEPQQVCLRWNSFHNNMQTMFPTLLNKEKFVDVTLACEGQTVKCHKVVLSSCSAYIERLLTENPCKHPIILMPNTMRYWQIRALVDFMYRGEVNVEHEQLSSLLAAAEFLQVKGLAGPPTSPEQNTNMEDPEPEPPLSPRPKRKRVASPSPVPQHRQPVATPPTPQPQQQQQQQQQRTSLPNSPAVSITRLKQSTAVAQATPSTSRDTGSRAQSPGIEITPVVSFEEIKMEPIDISDSNDESMDPNMHCDVDYDMDNGDGEGDKDYDDEDLDEDSGDAGRGAEDDTGGGGGDADPGPSLQPSTSDDQPGTSKTTSNGPDLTTPGFSGNGIEIDDSAASYCAADLGLTTEPPEDPPDSGAGPSGL